MGSRSDESIHGCKGWQVGDAAFCQITLDSCPGYWWAVVWRGRCETAAYLQAASVGQASTSVPAGPSKRSVRVELRRLIHESGIVIARDRLRLLDVIGQGHPVHSVVAARQMSHIAWSVCRSHWCTVQKLLNRSKCLLRCWLIWKIMNMCLAYT